MDTLKIIVHIADRPYPLNIRREEEEGIRKAVKLIEEQSIKYAEHFAHSDKQDLLAMVALQYAIEALSANTKLDESNNSLEVQLEEIGKILDNVL